ncbi:carbohydrate binding domain-containing protein [Catenulispora sp. GP43]|uniref:carbohydrate binding domain-containing protein n=1 Tax=Catenulispora sp. GP43 TaxID=3156263 RepID=UPI0035175F9E
MKIDPVVAAQNTARLAASAQAKKTGKPVPVPELTTEHATTQANPDGTFTASESVTPQRAKVGNTWQAIDTTLAKGRDGLIRPTSAVDHITVSAGGAGPLASVEIGGKTFTITWPLGPLPTPQLAGSDATYPGVLPGVDLKVTAAAEGISEVLIVHDAKAAANPALAKLRFGVSGTGVTIRTDSSGALVGVDADGQVVFKGATPLMWDSTPAPPLPAVLNATAASVAGTLTSQNPLDGPTDDAKTATIPVTLSGNTATMVPDAAILTGPTTVYPVIIDPAINASQSDFAEIRGGTQAGLSFYDGGPSNQGIDANGSFVRAGWDAGIGGAIRALFSFDVYDTLQGIDNGLGQNTGDYAEENSTNITEATFTVTAKGSTGCPAIPLFDVYRTNAFGSAPTWNSDGPTSSGAYGPKAKLLGQVGPNACGEPGQMSIDDTADVKTVYTNAFNEGNTHRAALGVRIATEASNNPYWSFYAHDNNNPGAYDARLNITYVSAPYITQLSTTPALTSSAGCGDQDTAGALQQNAGYLQKNIGNQVTLGAQFTDIDGNRPIQTNYWFIDHDLNNNYFIPGPGQTNYYGNVNSVPGHAVGFPTTGATLTQNAGQLQEGHLYSFEPYAQDAFDSGYLNSNVAGSTQECFFRVAFNAPDPPTVNAPDFPQLGKPSLPNMYATMADSAGFQITGTTTGVNIDHFDYVLNGDSSKVGDTSAGGGSVAATVTGTALAGNGAIATIPVPQGMTTFGTNTLWVRAVDKAGNQSQFRQYDFYLPGNPAAVATLGNVTGNGVPDVVAAQPVNPAQPTSATNPEHLVTYPGNSDPNAGSATYSKITEAAPAADAPDGASWANTLITHRGALRGTAVDDLFAYNTITHGMYYYLNKNVFGGVMNSDQFAANQKVVIQRPVCTPAAANNFCIGYAPDWSGVKSILAFGNAAGNRVGTFAGRTNFFTVEDDGNHGGNLWMFSPGPGLGQLSNPILISGDGSWLDKDLMAVSDPNGGLPDLWVRDQGTGTLYQYQNKLNASNVEDPTSLGNVANRTTFPGSYPVTAYGTLTSAGNPNFKPNSSGQLTGSLTQDGPAALAAVQPDGQLKILPGSSTGPVTSAHGDWDTSQTAWTATNGITQVNGAGISTTSGVFESGAWDTLCLDLNNGDPSPGNYVQLWQCNGLVNQNWNVFSDGTIRFSGNTASCVEVGPSPGDIGATMAGDPIIMATCPVAGALPSAAEHWILRASDGQHGAFNLYNPASGRCLDALANNGQHAQLFDCVDTASSPRGAQQWFTPASAVGTQTTLGAGMATATQEQATQSTSIITSPQYYDGSAYQLAGQAVGDHYGVDYYVPYDGDYIVWTGMITNSAYGIDQLTVDSTVMPNTFNAYGSTGYGTPYWGKIHLTAGRHSFVFTSIGKDSRSTGYGIGLDYLQLQPVHGTGPSDSLVLSSVSGTNNSSAVNQPVTADASGSLPGTAAITSYTFDFGDGTVAGPQSGPTASHTYTVVGTYEVKATVTDSNGAVATATRPVTILSSPPVANGDFETGTLSGWTASYNSGITTTNPHGGTYAGQINAPTGGSGSIEQVVNGLKPNTSYTLSGWIRTDGGVTNIGTKNYDADPNDDTGNTTTATAWTLLTSQFTTGPTNTSVDIYCYRSTAGTSACDDFTLMVTPAAGAVANPDFETGNLAGWSAAYNSGITTTNPHGGTYAGQINAPTGGNGSIEQVVTGLIPNTSYTLTGWIRTDGGSTILGTKDYDADPGDDTGATTTNTGWTQLTSQFTTGPTNTSVDIYCYRSTAGTSACDDFSLAQTPATVANGNFESGDLSGWSVSYNSGITTTNPHGGTYAGQINAPTGGNGSIEQIVGGLTPNTTYTLSGWIRTDGGVTNIGTKNYDADPNDDTGNTTTATTWTQLSSQFTTGPTNTTVDIYCYRSTAGTSACDDFTLTKN